MKLRLPDKAAYDKVAALLEPGKRASYAQDNFFFDGDKRELESRRAVMRLRFYNGDEKATITVKGKQLLVDGIGRASEVEEDVEPGLVKAARAQWLQEPGLMVAASPLLQKLNAEWGIERIVCLGGFSNHRTEYVWTHGGEGSKPLTLELDATGYEWGTLYEIECETTEPEVVRDQLKAMLESQGIPYSYSATSKFANFINKTLL